MYRMKVMLYLICNVLYLTVTKMESGRWGGEWEGAGGGRGEGGGGPCTYKLRKA